MRRSHVESWVKKMDATLAASTIDTRASIVRSVLRAAVADKVIAEDPRHRGEAAAEAEGRRGDGDPNAGGRRTTAAAKQPA
ncbi:hypothetical protein [Knoellia subterranea]|uniref:hypothetical protein n=1 Tax=Knoellia subterranea TaxID=184882 RepID=UPI000A9E23A1|nr:hypothetical protein [Knoellia subterranea]